MAKNYVNIYEGGNVSSALEQKIFAKVESVRGTMVLPDGTDFFYHMGGGSVNKGQPYESSPHKTGRHHTSIIKNKESSQWTIPTLFNIDESLGSASTAEIDPAVRLLHKSLFGKEDVSGGSPVFNTEDTPSITFTIMEIGDMWAKQAPGCFVESGNMQFPGDGMAQTEWSGFAKTVYTIGMGKSTTDNNTGNTVTLQTDEGKNFQVGGYVMLIKNDNSKSADTPADTGRLITGISGDVITVDGAVLADADGSSDPVYLVYFEPESATAIDNPVTGLTGDLEIAGFSTITNCVRSFNLNCANNHELQDYCFGEEGLGGKLFVPGGRFTAEVTMELNVTKELIGFMNNLQEFSGENITLYLGLTTGRHLKIEVPKAIFNVPELSVPESGAIPITFNGTAFQTALDAADEVTLSYL